MVFTGLELKTEMLTRGVSEGVNYTDDRDKSDQNSES